MSSRFDRTGNMGDLEAAIERTEAAVSATPIDHPGRAALLNNLGIRLCRRYGRTGNMADLEAAIERNEAAVAITPVDHPERTVRLLSLAESLHRQFKLSADSCFDIQHLDFSLQAWNCTSASFLDRINAASLHV